MSSTKTDETARVGSVEGGVLRLRQWGTDLTHVLPGPSLDTAREGSPRKDRDLSGKGRLRLDGIGGDWSAPWPCSELGIGETTLIAENGPSVALRMFLARLLGWSSDRAAAVDLALRSIHMAATRRSALVLCGRDKLVSIARALHRRAIGADRPFVVCDPRRREAGDSVRAAMNYRSAVAAVRAAAGGSLCIWDAWRPRDFPEALERFRNPGTRVQLIACSAKLSRKDALLASAIEIPPLTKRAGDLGRIVDEYALDALAELGEPRTSFTATDRDWVLAHEATSFGDIEKATLRLVALRTSPNVHRAAVRLGMRHVSLSRWIGRRKLPIRTD